jgi:hypothetical protein
LLCGLALICTLFVTLSFLTIPKGEYSKFKTQLISQVPNVIIENGALSIDRAIPYYFTFEREERIAVIDTSDTASNMSLDAILAKMKNEKIVAFVGRHKIVTLKDNNQSRVYDLTEVKEKLTFGQTEVAKLINVLEIFLLAFMPIFMFLFFWVYKIFQMLIYSLFAMLIDKFVKSGLEYTALQRITTCAIFPATIIGVIFSITGSGLPFILSFIGTLVFIFFGIKSVNLSNELGAIKRGVSNILNLKFCHFKH